MIALYFLIGAVALLLTLLLFGFVGCDIIWGLDHFDKPMYGEPYPTVVLGEDDLVAYWRLGESDGTTILPASMPIPPGAEKTAKDEKNGFDGYYLKLDLISSPDTLRHSPATSGTITLGEDGIIEIEDPQIPNSCIDTDGGYVQVPFNDLLNPPQFTFEAWVVPDASLLPGFYYCLVESTGPPVAGPLGKQTGWGLYLGPSDINNPTGPLFWQVWMGDGTQFKKVAIANGSVTPTQIGILTYLAVTFDGTNLRLWLYYPGFTQELTIVNFLGAQANVTTPLMGPFFRNDTTNAGQGDFFIGTGSNLTIFGTSQRLYPFRGKIQEVALYNSNLAGSAPNFEELWITLAAHVSSGKM